MTAPASIDRTWSRVAERTARRVNRRARTAAALAGANVALLAAGAAAVAFRAVLGTGSQTHDGLVVAGLLTAGVLAGGVLALRRAGRARPVGAGDAAWALDRLAGAGGRGLAAAVVSGPAGAEAAWAEGAVAPPARVGLVPPRGLGATLAAGGLFVLAFLAPAAGDGGAARDAVWPQDAGAGAGQGDVRPGAERAAGARAAEAEARRLDARALETRRVRELLNLPADGPLDPQEVAERLADAARRERAAEAATPGTALAEALAGGQASGDALARLLGASDADPAAASHHRRHAAGARARHGDAPVPPGRRALVTRYLQELDPGRTDGAR